MSTGITKDCFPPASMCHNCLRKGREDILENPEGRKEFKRCTGCHLLTYCDRDCQREHWQKVHKRHCGFLSGQKLVQNSQHKKENCSLCLEERRARSSEINSIMSPKTCCHIQMLMSGMKKRLGISFEFHKENKRCKCSCEFACQLPFPLGEISGSYVGNGQDEMVAHALKIIHAIGTKDRNENLGGLLNNLIWFRINNWTLTLIYGKQVNQNDNIIIDHLAKLMENLKLIYGVRNPWWQALFFAANMIMEMDTQLSFDCWDFSNSVFSNVLKQTATFQQSQLKNHEFVTRNNLWSVFKLWPVQANGRLTLLLPDGTNCQTCNKPFSGQFYIMDHNKGLNCNKEQVNLPLLMSRVKEDGQLTIVCSNARCLKGMFSKDYLLSVQTNNVLLKNQVEDQKMFFAKARICDFCLKYSLSSHRCLECKASQYCSTQCQREDLTFHKTVCTAWANDKLRKIANAKNQQKRSESMFDKCFKK